MNPDVQAAARFVLLSVSATRPGEPGSEYAALRERYQAEPNFRRLTHDIAEGLMLDVRGMTPTRLVLVPQPDSPFEEKVRTYRTNDQRELLDALALIAVVATAYPQPETLDDTGLRRFGAADVLDTLRDLIERNRARAGTEYGSGEEDQGAWRLLDRLSEYAKGKNARALETYVDRALNKLEAHGLLMPFRGARQTNLLTTDALRLLARDVVGTSLYQELHRQEPHRAED